MDGKEPRQLYITKVEVSPELGKSAVWLSDGSELINLVSVSVDKGDPFTPAYVKLEAVMKPEKKEEPMKAYVLLDRSGSMEPRWAEVQSAVVRWLENIKPDTKVWINVFDDKHDVVVAGIEAKHAASILNEKTKHEIRPRGMTALNDAVGRLDGIIAITAKKKAQIVIVTDGLENCSQEITATVAKGIINKWKMAGYDVVYLGADLSDMKDAVSLGIARQSTMSFDSASAGATADVMTARSAAYASGQAEPAFSDEDRKKVGDKSKV